MLRNYYGLSAYLDKKVNLGKRNRFVTIILCIIMESEDQRLINGHTCTSSKLLAMCCTLCISIYNISDTCSPSVHHRQQYPKKALYDLRLGNNYNKR